MKQAAFTQKSNNVLFVPKLKIEEELPKEAFEMVPSEGEEVASDDVF